MGKDTSQNINAEDNRPVIEIFWTGGFDSTFRIVQLSRCDVRIQPYYMCDNRKSELNELNAIQSITKVLKQHKDTKCEILDLKIIKISDRIDNIEVSKAYEELRKTDFFGGQYSWLACFAIHHKGIELSIHEDDKAIKLIQKYGQLKQVNDPIIRGGYWVLDPMNSKLELKTLFENYHLPLAGWTKLKMKEFYIKYGYEEIMQKTWFCYDPIHGKPCGICNPCIYTIEEGMKERFTKSALFRYHIKKTLQRLKIWPNLQKVLKE